MSSLLDTVSQQIGGDTIGQISKQIGADESTTTNAVQLALPMLLGGLASNASQPGGADALHRALDAHDGGVLGNLAGMFANPQGAGAGGILSHILGSRQAPVQNGIGRATGLDAGQVGKLLMLLAPIVMGVLGRMKRQQNMDPGQLGNVLQQTRADVAERAPAAGGILGGLFDKNHDGQITDDIARMAPGMLGGIFGKR